MNKTELIAAVAEKAGLSKKDSDAAVNAVLCAITDALKADEGAAGGLWLFRDQEARRPHRPESPYRRERGDPRFHRSRLQGRQRL